jgi:putative acetyltransferase
MTDPIPFTFRLFRPADAAPLAALFHDAVLAAAGYDPAAREAWASAAGEVAAFGARLARGVTLVALRGSAHAGFGQLHPADHIEMLPLRVKDSRRRCSRGSKRGRALRTC